MAKRPHIMMGPPRVFDMQTGEETTDVSLVLKVSSWKNLFAVIRDKDTKLNTEGNFWAAIQHLESQLEQKTKDS